MSLNKKEEAMNHEESICKSADAASSWYEFIDISFLPVELKEKYKDEIKANLGKFQ